MALRSLFFCTIYGISLCCALAVAAADQEISLATDKAGEAEPSQEVAKHINVNPSISDDEIEHRLTAILEASGWFENLQVAVDQGIVFIDGTTQSVKKREWAKEVAGNLLDVTAVVNRIAVDKGSPWDLQPVIDELGNLWKGILQIIPRALLGIIVLFLVWKAAKKANALLHNLFERRFNPLLRELAGRIISILAFLLGIYLALQIAGLTGLAATVLGGTGLAGLVAGIAFRDILENYLASILISLRNPFRIGDFVQINEDMGIVEKVTTRGTVLMNLNGNHVQIPNAIVYKTVIRNFTANPNRRDTFSVGIGYENQAADAQKTALEVLAAHPAVLEKPEPLVLVDSLGAATVNLVVYFWYDGTVYNVLKIRSSLIRLVKKAFEEENISMPDEARERIFPEGVSVQMHPRQEGRSTFKQKPSHPSPKRGEEVSTAAEGALASEQIELRDQARTSRVPEEGASLIDDKT